MDDSFDVSADIRSASTLPSRVYADPAVLEACREHVLARSWQFIGDVDAEALNVEK